MGTHFSRTFNTVRLKLWRGFAFSLLMAFGLLSIVATGGGNGDGGGNAGTLQFSTTAYSGNEDAGNITVTVTRTGGSTGAATVDVVDAGSGSATSGTDYTAIATTTLSWADGDAADKTFTLSAIADGAVEADETVDLALSNATGATMGTPTSSTVTILNDDISSPGTLQFDRSNFSVSEVDGNATITVTRSGGDTGTVGVTYATTPVSATDGSDYTSVSSTLSWNGGDSSAKTFQVPIINDTDVEVLETVRLTLSSPTGGATLGSPSTATLTISSEDKFGTIKFGANSFNVSETGGTVSNVIALQRVDGSSGAISVDVTDTGSGTADGLGVDYTFTSPTTVDWTDGDTADKNVTIVLENDVGVESTETVILSLGNATGGAIIGTPDMATVNIADDDAPPAPGEIQFDSASYSVSEDGGSVTITVNRINGTSGVVGVSYASSDGTATAGQDYTAASGTLSWGDTIGGAQTFTIDITDDTDVEAAETITLTVSSPTGGASLGTLSTATLTINVDDTNLTMNIGDGSNWVAFQDGPGGAWVPWTPTSGNAYDFPVTDSAGRYGVAFHRQETDGTNSVDKTYVIHATIGELASLNAFHNPRYTVSGNLSGLTGSSDSAFVGMHVREDGGEPMTDPYMYTLERVPGGLRDLVAMEYNATTWAIGNFYINRGINLTGDLTDQNVDFGTDGTATTFTLNTFSGTAVDQWLEVYYSTDNGTATWLESDVYDGSTPIEYPYLTNTELKQSGDAYSFQVFKVISLGSGSGAKYKIRNFSATSDPGNPTMGLGNIANLTGTSTSSVQASGLSYTPDPTSFTGSPVFRGFQIDIDQTQTGVSGGAHWEIKISPAWLDTSTSYVYPVFSGVSGFDASWDLQIGISTQVDLTAFTSNNGTSLSLIYRKTMGPTSFNLDTWVVSYKLAQNDSLKLDWAQAYFLGDW